MKIYQIYIYIHNHFKIITIKENSIGSQMINESGFLKMPSHFEILFQTQCGSFYSSGKKK